MSEEVRIHLHEMESGSDPPVIEVFVPVRIRKRGGRKRILPPSGALEASGKPIAVDTTVLKALARAFRWRKLLEDGLYGTINEIAAAEKINSSYVSRILRLSLLAPDIVDGLLDGTLSATILSTLLKPFSSSWPQQRSVLLREQ